MTDAPGFHGKVPSHGDFVTRRLPRAFLDPWDNWLQGAIASSREQLGPEWLDIYLTSPLWRFVLSPGICGPTPWAGLLMPSVDRVGRYFPFTLACALPEGVNPLTALPAINGWYEQAETLVLSALEDHFDLESFDRAVSTLGQPLAAPPLPAMLPPLEGERQPAWHFTLQSPGTLVSAAPELSRQLLRELFFGYSVWWSAGSERIDSSLLLCQGLPPHEGFAALLAGDWPRRGWQERLLPETL